MSLPFQPWPSLPLAAEWPLGVLREFYVRTDGSDITGQGIPSRPYRTPERALRELQSFGRGIVNLGSGSYPRPLMNGIRGPVVLVGDGGGDPADDGLTEVEAPAASQAGTGAGVVVGAGYVAGGQRGNAIEVLSGAAAGQRRTVVDNTATDLIPARNFDPAPAPGDTFRVVQPAVVFTGFDTSNVWIQGCGVRQHEDAFGPSGSPSVAGSLDAIYLVNLALDASASALAHIAGSQVKAFGLECRSNVALHVRGADLFCGGDGGDDAATLGALLGLTATQYAGYTLARRGATSALFAGASLFGFLGGDAGQLTLVGGTAAQVRGGALFQRVFMTHGSRILLNKSAAVPRTQIARTGAGDCISMASPGCSAIIGTACEVSADSGRALAVSTGSSAQVSGTAVMTSVSGTAVDASQGGRVYATSAPAGNWAGGGADTRVSATETQPAAFYAAVDDTLVAGVGNGSLVTRVA